MSSPIFFGGVLEVQHESKDGTHSIGVPASETCCSPAPRDNMDYVNEVDRSALNATNSSLDDNLSIQESCESGLSLKKAIPSAINNSITTCGNSIMHDKKLNIEIVGSKSMANTADISLETPITIAASGSPGEFTPSGCTDTIHAVDSTIECPSPVESLSNTVLQSGINSSSSNLQTNNKINAITPISSLCATHSSTDNQNNNINKNNCKNDNNAIFTSKSNNSKPNSRNNISKKKSTHGSNNGNLNAKKSPQNNISHIPSSSFTSPASLFRTPSIASSSNSNNDTNINTNNNNNNNMTLTSAPYNNNNNTNLNMNSMDSTSHNQCMSHNNSSNIKNTSVQHKTTSSSLLEADLEEVLSSETKQTIPFADVPLSYPSPSPVSHSQHVYLANPFPVIPNYSPPVPAGDTLLFLDWDDTILPTTLLCLKNLISPRHLLEPSTFIPAEDLRNLERVAFAARRLIALIMCVGTPVIVTSADAGWVELSCKAFLPILWEFFIQHPCRVMSARNSFETRGPCAFTWKSHAFAREVAIFYGDPIPPLCASTHAQRIAANRCEALPRTVSANLDPYVTLVGYVEDGAPEVELDNIDLSEIYGANWVANFDAQLMEDEDCDIEDDVDETSIFAEEDQENGNLVGNSNSNIKPNNRKTKNGPRYQPMLIKNNKDKSEPRAGQIDSINLSMQNAYNSSSSHQDEQQNPLQNQEILNYADYYISTDGFKFFTPFTKSIFDQEKRGIRGVLNSRPHISAAMSAAGVFIDRTRTFQALNYGSCSLRHIISIGDSEHERFALLEILRVRPNPNVTNYLSPPSDSFQGLALTPMGVHRILPEDCKIIGKSLKLIEKPGFAESLQQLTFVSGGFLIQLASQASTTDIHVDAQKPSTDSTADATTTATTNNNGDCSNENGFEKKKRTAPHGFSDALGGFDSSSAYSSSSSDYELKETISGNNALQAPVDNAMTSNGNTDDRVNEELNQYYPQQETIDEKMVNHTRNDDDVQLS